MGENVSNLVRISFNEQTLRDYTEHYFKCNPKRKKPPLDWAGKKRNGQLVSWNRFINSPNRIMQNQWKQEFSDYTTFVLNKQGIEPLGINKCAILVKQYQPTRAKSDSDNIMCKATLDSMVKFGLLEEDNYTVVNPVVLVTGYDKDNPRTEFIIFIIDEENPLDVIMNEIASEVVEINKK